MTEEPKPGLDDFLSAPDNVRNNEDEKQKLILRKAKLAAEEQRLRNSKSDEPPSREDLLADLVRVANDPSTNPVGFRFSTISRKRYRQFGNWYIEEIDKLFGQFNHALEQAGLRETSGSRMKKAATTARSRCEHAARYQERYFHQHLWDGVDLELTGTEIILSISDTHATFLSPFVWHCFLRACIKYQPDYIVLNGDILEGSDISRHPKIPGWSCSLQVEFDFAREMFRQIRQVAPDAEIIWTAGNHGLDRLAAYLSQVAPALACLDNLRFDKLAGVDEYGVKLAQGGSIASPKGTENDLPGILIHNYLLHHGTLLGQTPHLSELRKALRSGQSGHVHRAGVSFMSHEGASISWMSTPMGCTPTAGRAYMKGRHTGWQMGFGMAFLHPGGRVHQFPVICDEGVAMFEGTVIEDPGFPEPDVSSNWLTSFKVPS